MTDDAIRRGRRLLRELLPWARAAAAREPDAAWRDGSALGAATMSHVTEDGLDALMVYPAPLGGWHADLLLKRLPPGVPNVVGSPVGSPHPTRAAADEAARHLLVGMLVVARRNRAASAPARPPVFLLHGHAIELSEAVYAKALAAMPEFRRGYGSPEEAAERVAVTLEAVCPDGFDAGAFNTTWGRERKLALVTALHVAALSGLFAYPPRRDATPSGHAAPPGTRH